MIQELNNFFYMGGYGAYVWSSFGLCLLTLIINLMLPIITEKRILRDAQKRLAKTKEKS